MTCIKNNRCLQVKLATFRGLVSVSVVCVCLFTSVGCRKDDCQERVFISDDGVQINFKNKNGAYLYPVRNPSPTFNVDSLYMSNAQGRNFYQRKVLLSGSFGNDYYVYVFGDIYNSDTDEDALVKERCEDYFIHYNSTDIDTLRLCYQVAEGKCGLLYNSFKVYQRNQLIFQEQGKVVFTFDLVK